MNLLLPLTALLGFQAAGNNPPAPEISAGRMQSMRAVADGVRFVPASTDPKAKVERVADPVYRFNDPARRFSDGTVWAWGRAGRPAALLTLAKERTPEGVFQWICELTSLTSGPVSAEAPGGVVWAPPDPGFVMKPIPGARRPALTEAARLRQMKELARKFRAFEFFAPSPNADVERYELRTLPQPIRRYSDPSAKLIDGAAFVIAYGLNPEIFLLIEARQRPQGGSEWTFGMGRASIARLQVEFEGKEVWEHPGGYSRGPQDPYWLFVRPAEPDEEVEKADKKP